MYLLGQKISIQTKKGRILLFGSIWLRAPGVKCLLYEARKSLKNQQADETKLLEQLKEINPKMALAQILTCFI